jgi:plasmid maintenance system antidote protein VapI
MAETNYDIELADFQDAVAASFASMRHRKPTHPGVILGKIMVAEGVSNENVAKITGLSTAVISGIVSGKLPFSEDVSPRFKNWLGQTSDTLRTLQEMRDHFEKHGECPEPAPSTPDPRTVRYWAALRRNRAPA